MPEPAQTEARDTIAAIATPPGRGGVGMVRLSGPEALASSLPLLQGASGQPVVLAPAQATYCRLLDPATGVLLDEAVVTFFRAPRSYTGEDVVEIAAHGSPVLLDRLLRLLLAAGVRLAAPGEFTERAFLSGRIDLIQAEAVRDLIEAQTQLGAQLAAQQLGGALSRRVLPIKQTLMGVIATLEAGIDFAEDDTPVLSTDALLRQLHVVVSPLSALERSFARGRSIREGVTLAIVGRPNAGKSSLFNRLIDRERAIVTPEPGTTRDTVQERLSISGVPVELIDTAGLREAAGEAERMGIEKSREALADAGLVLLVLDSKEALNDEETTLLRAAAGRPLLIALNKSDLLLATAPVPAALTGIAALAPDASPVLCSALTGAGLEDLRAALARRLLGTEHSEQPMLTSLRQHGAVAEALRRAEAASEAAAAGLPHEVILLDLYSALRELDALTGATAPDDILHLVFSTFCIGK